MQTPGGGQLGTGADISHMGDMALVGPFWLPLLLLIPATVAYVVGVIRLTRRGDHWPLSQSVWGAVGLGVLTASLMPPLVDTMDFPVHVAQHLMLAMLAPLGLALSAPVTLALRTLPCGAHHRLLAVVHSRFARVVTFAPLILVLEVGGMYAYYLTPLFAGSHQHPWLHVAVHTHMLLAGCLLSWYLVGRDPMPSRASIRTSLIVLFLAAGSHDLLAKLMYADLLPHGAGPAEQIHAGAQIMFYGGDAIELALAIALLLRWYSRAGRQIARERRRTTITRPGTRHTGSLTRDVAAPRGRQVRPSPIQPTTLGVGPVPACWVVACGAFHRWQPASVLGSQKQV